MISLGSCTMKLNAASEMTPPQLEPLETKCTSLSPRRHRQALPQIVHELGEYLCKITAFDACSLQPNSGAQGEYAGLLNIRDIMKVAVKATVTLY